MDWPTLLKDYQTGLAGLLGFVGVIITLSVNAMLRRRQYRRTLDHESAAVRGALRAELKILSDDLQYRLDQLDAVIKQGGNFYVYVRMPTQVHDRLVDKLGLLTETQARTVIDAYTQFKLLPARVRLLRRDEPGLNDLIKKDDRFMIFVPASISGKVAEMYKHKIRLINEAIAALTTAGKADR